MRNIQDADVRISRKAFTAVTGVSGSGKSTVAGLLAERLGWAFVDGDDLQDPVVDAARAIADGRIAADRAPSTETDRLLAITGLTPLLDLGVITPDDAIAAIDRHLDDLFTP